MFWFTAPWPREAGVADVTVGAAFTVNTLPVAMVPSPFVTVTDLTPVVAVAPTVMLAITVVAFTNDVEFTVMRVPNDAASEAPLMNPVPVSVMFWFVAPRPREDGAAEVSVGAGLTLKTPVPVTEAPPGFVSVTSRAPVVALPEIVMFTVTCVLLLYVVELIVIPEPENATVAPVTKPVPEMAMFWLTAPWFRNDGLVDTPVSAGVTVKMPVPTPMPPSGLVTVMSRRPTVAPTARVMFAVTWVALVNVVELTVMPVPENVAAAPLAKPVPAITMF